MIGLRYGDWRTVLADVGEVDALIVDAPYSAKTHTGHDKGTAGVQPSAQKRGGYVMANGIIDAPYDRRSIDYSAFTPEDVHEFIDAWAPRCRGWMVSITDDVLFPVWREAMAKHNRQVFQDVVAIVSGMTVRLAGDGPSSWCLHIAVSRPRTREFSKWGTLPGGYYGPSESQLVVGGKPRWLMSALVGDYTRPGNLVVDPCSGGCSTLIAAHQAGQNGIGAELDPATYAKAKARVDTVLSQPLLFTDAPAKQSSILEF